MQSTLRNVGTGGGGGYAPRRVRASAEKGEQNSVLAEIFKSNVSLLRALEIGGVGEAAAAAPDPDASGDAAEPVAASAEPSPPARPGRRRAVGTTNRD